MSLAAVIQGTASRGAKRCGGGSVAVIRRSGPGIVSGATGDALTSLTVDGLVSAGGSTLSFDATSIQSGGVFGQGWEFTLPGHTAAYVVQADVTAASNALAAVSILPVLSHDATDDSTATITQDYGEWTYPAWREDFDREHVTFEAIGADDYKLVLSVLGAPFTDINKWGDVDAVTWDGKRRSVVRVMPIEPGTVPAVLRLHCRG